MLLENSGEKLRIAQAAFPRKILVFGGDPLGAVDHQDFGLHRLRLQMQAELLFHGGKDGWERGGSTVPRARSVGGPFQIVRVDAVDPRFVDHGSLQFPP